MPLKDDYQRDRLFLLNGQLLNKRARRLNAGQAGYSVDSAMIGRPGGRTSRYPTTKVRQFVVTDDSDDCPSDSLGNVTAPCSSQGFYLGWVKYFDNLDRRWVGYEGETQVLDGSAIGTTYKKGDVVPVYWDQIRGSWVPLAAATPAAGVPYYHGELITTPTGVPVLNRNIDNEVFDNDQFSFASVYLQIRRPEDDEWQHISRVNWMIPFIDTQRAWDETRAGLATFEATPKTLVRFVTAGLWQPALGDDFDFFDIGEFRWLGFGITNRVDDDTYNHEAGDFNPAWDEEDVSPIQPYHRITEVAGRTAGEPKFSFNQHGVITIDFDDPDSRWIVGFHYQAMMRMQRNVSQRRGGAAYPWMTRIQCTSTGLLQLTCFRDFGFPGGPGARIDFGSSQKPEVCFPCGENPCGNCTWEWTQDPTSTISIDGVDFWNNNDPCLDTGPSDCECDEPTRDGAFYGEIFLTPCYQTGSSTSTPTTASSTSLSTISSTSSRSSMSSISASSSTQSHTTSSLSSTSSLGGG